MSQNTNDDYKSRKKELLTFLLAKQVEQPKLFREIINKELNKIKKYIEERSKDEKLINYNKILDKMIYESKLKEINSQTKVLKEQIIAQEKGITYPSCISIIERKLAIIEMQLDIGIYNLVNKTGVKFYFET